MRNPGRKAIESRLPMKRLFLSISLVASVLVVGDARADKVAEALKLLDKGIELFKQDKLDEARTAFLKVREMVPDKANPYRWLGLVEARLGHCAQAVDYLDRFITRVPGKDPRTIEAVTVRDRCRDELTPKLGKVIIESTPSGADVRLDTDTGVPVGTTPFQSAEVKAGSHVVNLSKTGFQAVSKVFALSKGDTVRLDVVLNAELAPVVVTSANNPITTTTTPPPKKSKVWIGVLAAGLVGVAALGVGLGVGLSRGAPQEAVFPSVAGF